MISCKDLRRRFGKHVALAGVTFSVGKNRMGPQYVEFEHQLHGPYYCFNPQGSTVRAKFKELEENARAQEEYHERR